MELENIHPAVTTNGELAALLARDKPANPHHAKGYRPGQWLEVRENDFWYYLGSSAPLAYTGTSFALEEFVTGNLTNSFHHIGGRYFCMVVAYKGRATMLAAAAALAAMIENDFAS
jgi:hypothetical protein